MPEPLPPQPNIVYDGELQTLLSNADRDIARLDAIAALLPNPDFFVAMYVRHEAVLSSQIEGTQSTLEDILAFEAQGVASDSPKDVEEVINYVAAMNHGLQRLAEVSQSLRLLREVTGFERNRLYRYQPYMDLFHRETIEAAFETTAA
jgi:Fic family protein